MDDAYKARLRAANISDETCLATDYLNHFNEIIMLLQLIPDIPDMLDYVMNWQPKSYPDHFRDSVFAERDLAIEAYEKAPETSRRDLEATVSQLNAIVAQTAGKLDAQIRAGDLESLGPACAEAAAVLGRLVEIASAVIHGTYRISAQSEIDRLIAQN